MKKSLLFLLLLLPIFSYAQLAEGQTKFLGNIVGFNGVPSNFGDYWNQLTPENSSKWSLTEETRDVMNWGPLDEMYNYCQNNNFPFKQHTFVWGSQEPTWVSNLSESEQIAEVEEWISLYAQRYPNTDMIDVVNEPLHVLPSYKDAIGGDGVTGWDWVIWSFEKVRQYLPNAQLILNDYSILNNSANVTEYLVIINLLKDRGLIDGIGVQAHGLETSSASLVKSSLDALAATGLPIYISEFEIDKRKDNQQKAKYEELFPVFWEHPGVEGVTLWGYIEGQIWKRNAFLIRSNGEERSALIWLREYLANYGGPGPGSNGTKVYVESLFAEATSSKGNKKGKVTVVIYDDDGVPYSNATVTGTFSGSINETSSATTDGSGIAVISTASSVKGGINYNFCVIDVTAELPYDEVLNTVTCAGLGTSLEIQEENLFPGSIDNVNIGFRYTGNTDGSYDLYNISGIRLATGIISRDEEAFFHGLNTGKIYFLRINNAAGSYVKKLIFHE